MRQASCSDHHVASVLARTRTVAVVGASSDPSRPSHGVVAFLLAQGYRVFPVNPALAGGTILGLPVHARLADLPEPIDMVDVFRRSDAVAAVVDEVLAMEPKPKALWTQLGVRDDAAAARAEAAGLDVVMDRCPKIEYPRLFGGGRGAR